MKNIASQMLLKLRTLNRERVQQRRLGRVMPNSPRVTRYQRVKYQPSVAFKGSPGHPLVSVIIVGHNGCRHLPELLGSLAAQSYPNFEVIYVDNASTDGSCEQIAALMPGIKVIRSQINAGFAEGNNIGADHAKGEFLLLLNNDAKLEPDALERMVAALLADDSLGVIAPKIRFWERFVEYELHGPGLPVREVAVTVSKSSTGYHKVIAPDGKVTQVIRVPEGARELSASYKETPYKVATPKLTPLPELLAGGKLVPWGSELPVRAGKWVINNAGSWVSKNGDSGDWGLGEFDEGQYDEPALVDAFCGCCALIRRSVLGLKPLFAPTFFAYFEDTDLSERITAAGFNILYLPSALAYHKHAATSVEHSPFFTYFARRNHLAFQVAHFKIGNSRLHARLERWRLDGSAALTSLSILGPNPFSNELGLSEDALRLMAQAQNGTIYNRELPRKRIGIFNEFWDARGGGELRALHVAQQLTSLGDVYLISKRPLDLNALCEHFGMAVGDLKVAIVPNFRDEDTVGLDIFINTAFQSKIYSRAKKSAYLVSFPHVDGHFSSMLSYDVVLANSIFTEKWCRHIWPDACVELLYPSVDQPESVSVDHKTRSIVSIGRFFDNGHGKKQLEMVEAFSRLVNKPGMSDWRLVLIGGCNVNQPADIDYLNKVRERAAGLPIDILDNASAERAQKALLEGSIYWHATGVGLPDYEPGRFEHFGMAIVEAMSNGLVPVVHGRGGAPEIMEHGKSGYHFQTLDDLVEHTLRLVQMREAQPQAFFEMARAAHERAKAFSSEAHRATLMSLAQRYLV